MKILSKSLLAMGALLLLISGAMGKSKKETPNQTNPTIRLAFKKGTGGISADVIDTKGHKQALTFGTFLSAATEAMLGKKLDECTIDKGETIAIFFGQGSSEVYFDYGQGQKPFVMNTLLNALPYSIRNCAGEAGNQPPPSDGPAVQIYFQKEKGGRLQTYIVHPDGRKELLTLGNLLCATTELVKNCNMIIDDSRSLNIVFEKKPEGFDSVLIDAAGNRSDITLQDLVSAAAHTLVFCQGEKMPAKKGPMFQSGTTIQIFFKKDPKGHLEAFIVDSKGKKRDFNLGTLLDASVGMLPCEEVRPIYLDISFIKNNGSYTINVTDPDGKTKELEILDDLVNYAAQLCGY